MRKSHDPPFFAFSHVFGISAINKILFGLGGRQFSLALVIVWLPIAPVPAWAAQEDRRVDGTLLPVTRIEGPVTTVSEFLAYGPWEIPSRGSWHKAPAELPLADGRVLWAELEKPPFNAAPRLTGDATSGVDYAPFAAADDWKGSHVMLLACKVIAGERTLVVLDISNDDNADIYINGNYLGVTANWVMPQGGQFHAFPAWLEKGENILLFKHVTTSRAPRFKVNIVCDGSRDFDAAIDTKTRTPLAVCGSFDNHRTAVRSPSWRQTPFVIHGTADGPSDSESPVVMGGGLLLHCA
jgi:hypothetical protein